jgi:hypothetical protein
MAQSSTGTNVEQCGGKPSLSRERSMTDRVDARMDAV